MTKRTEPAMSTKQRSEDGTGHTPEPNMNVRRDEAVTIGHIAKRAADIAKARRIKWTALEFSMDITACHANNCPLRLNDLLEADDFNFIHDVFGIRSHLNRETGRLENHFLPRFRSVIAGDHTPVEVGVGPIPAKVQS